MNSTRRRALARANRRLAVLEAGTDGDQSRQVLLLRAEIEGLRKQVASLENGPVS